MKNAIVILLMLLSMIFFACGTFMEPDEYVITSGIEKAKIETGQSVFRPIALREFKSKIDIIRYTKKIAVYEPVSLKEFKEIIDFLYNDNNDSLKVDTIETYKSFSITEDSLKIDGITAVRVKKERTDSAAIYEFILGTHLPYKPLFWSLEK